MNIFVGPVLIDYPYVYELDGAKLYCNKPDPTSVSGTCDGELDYDDGFNTIRCTKCGKTFKAIELEKKIKDNEIIVDDKGEIKMKVTRRGGSLGLHDTIEIGSGNENFADVKTSVPVSTNVGSAMPRKKTVKLSLDDEVVEDNFSFKVVKNTKTETKVEKPVVEEVKVEEPVEEVVEETKVEEPVVEATHTVNKTVNGVSTKVKAVSPISISDEIKEEAIANAKPEEEGKTPVVAIEDAIKIIFDNIDKIELDTVRDSIVESLYNKVVDLYGFDKTFNILCKALSDTFENIKDDDYVNAVTNETLVETLKHIYEPRVEVVNVMRENSDVIIDFKPVLGLKYDFDSKDRYEVYSADESSFVAENLIEETTTYTPEEKTEGTVETTTEEETESTYYYTGMAFYNAKVMNIKELFPKEQPCDVIVLLDADGNYMRDETQIIGIDRINDRTVNSSTIVSKSWFNAVTSTIEEETEEVDMEKEVAPGMTMEQFLAAEEASTNNNE